MNFPPPSPGQARLMWTALTALALSVLLAALALFVWGIGQVLALLAPVLWPLAVAGIIAYLLDPVVDFLVARRVARTKAILTVFVGALLLMTAIMASVVPQLYRETKEFAERVPGYANRVQGRLDNWMAHPPALLQKFLRGENTGSTTTNTSPAALSQSPVAEQGVQSRTTNSTSVVSMMGRALDRDALNSATTWLADVLPKLGHWALGKVSQVASWLGILAGLALVPVYAFYFLLEKRGIEKRWSDYLPVRNSKLKDEVVFVLQSINDYLIVFFRSQLLVAVCDGILYTIGFLVIGLPYALLLGVLAIFLTMIPFLGAITICAAALVIAFAQYGDWMHPALVLAVFAVVQTLEGLVISPKIMGDRVGLHPLTIIISVMVGTTVLGGLLGGILAIPLTAAFRVLMFRYIWKAKET